MHGIDEPGVGGAEPQLRVVELFSHRTELADEGAMGLERGDRADRSGERQHSRKLSLVAAAASERKGLGPELRAPLRLGPKVQLLGEDGHHARPRGRVSRSHVECALDQPDALVVARPSRTERAERIREDRAREASDVAKTLPDSAGLEQRVAEGRIAELTLGFAEADQRIAAPPVLLRTHLERVGEPRLGYVGSNLLEARSPASRA